MRTMSSISKAFIAVVVMSGAAAATHTMAQWQRLNSTRFLALLAASLLASILRLKLPGLTGTMSMNLPFIMVAVGTLSAPEALLIACLSTLAQCMHGARLRMNPVQAVFNFCNMALAVTLTQAIFGSAATSAAVASPSLRMGLATGGFFLGNTIPVAIVISLTEKASTWRTWGGMFQLSFPYYVASAGIAAAALTAKGQVGWESCLLVLLLMLGVLHSYRRYFPGTPRFGESGSPIVASRDVADVVSV